MITSHMTTIRCSSEAATQTRNIIIWWHISTLEHGVVSGMKCEICKVTYALFPGPGNNVSNVFNLLYNIHIIVSGE